MCGFNKQIPQFFNWITCLLLQHQLGKSISHFPSLSCIIPAKTWKQKKGVVKAVLTVIIFHRWHFHGMQTSSIGITHATEYCDVLASCTGGVWVCLDCKSPPQAKTRKITFTIAPSTGQEGRLIEENVTWEDTVILPCTVPPWWRSPLSCDKKRPANRSGFGGNMVAILGSPKTGGVGSEQD